MKFSTTKNEATHCSVAVFGRSGAGKTTLIKTCPKPIIISSEEKLFALRHENFPVILVKTLDDFKEAIKEVKSKKCKKFETVCIDSITDIAETVLVELSKTIKDGRQLYGQLGREILEALSLLKTIKKKYVFVIAQGGRVEDDGILKMLPLMPGGQLKLKLNYYFDFVFCLEVNDDEDDQYRYLITQPNDRVDAKGCDELEKIEKPDLGKIFKKALKKK